MYLTHIPSPHFQPRACVQHLGHTRAVLSSFIKNSARFSFRGSPICDKHEILRSDSTVHLCESSSYPMAVTVYQLDKLRNFVKIT